jgi:uncharacterized repeat protein (TIGR02543 family)
MMLYSKPFMLTRKRYARQVFGLFGTALVLFLAGCKSPTADPAPQVFTVSGTVSKSGGGAASGAMVSLEKEGANSSIVTSAGSDGAYAITDVTAGTYTITASLAGYDPVTSPAFEVNGNIISRDITLQRIIHTVTFDVNGGDALGAGEGTRTVYHDAAIGTLPGPTRTGWTFDGWYTATNGGTQYTASSTVTADITLYARWTGEASVSYTVTFEVNGGNALGAGQDIRTVNQGSAIGTLPVATRTGYTFDGWYTATSEGIQYIAASPVTANITLYARWTLNTYTVTFDVNGGDALVAGQGSRTVNHGVAIGTLPTPTRTGYTFEGWYTATSEGIQYTAASPVTADIILYARWTLNTYTVTFDMNGGNPIGAGESSRTMNYGVAIGNLPEATRPYYTLDGWYTASSGGTQYTASSTVTANITLYAHWTLVAGNAGITITFEQLVDISINIPPFTVYKTDHGNSALYSASQTITLTNIAAYTSIAWYVDNGTAALSNTDSVTVSAGGYSVSAHTLTVEVIKDGVPYSRNIGFLVKQ